MNGKYKIYFNNVNVKQHKLNIMKPILKLMRLLSYHKLP